MVPTIAAKSYAAPVQTDGAHLPIVYVILKKPGEVYVGNRRTSLRTLVADVEDADRHADPRAIRILMQCNARIGYDEFKTYLKRLQGAGYAYIGIINDPPIGSNTSK